MVAHVRTPFLSRLDGVAGTQAGILPNSLLLLLLLLSRFSRVRLCATP